MENCPNVTTSPHIKAKVVFNKKTIHKINFYSYSSWSKEYKGLVLDSLILFRS